MSRVLVVGGGVIGLATAWHCARRGHQVTVVERLPRDRNGCSFGNAGMVVPSHVVPLAAPGAVGTALKWMLKPESPFYLEPRLDSGLAAWCWRFLRSSTAAHVEACGPVLADLHLRSHAGFQAMAEAGMEFGLKEHGLFMLCRSERGLAEEAQMAVRARELGMRAEVLDAEATARKESKMSMAVSGSVFYPLDCHLHPQRFMAEMEAALQKMGVEFLYETEVREWRVEGSQVRAALTADGRSLEADEWVLCAGIWSQETVTDLRLNLPLQAGRGYSVTVEQPRQTLRSCALLAEARVAVTPVNEGLRFGGTMEIVEKSAPLRLRRVNGIARAACEYFPAFSMKDFEGLKPWSGMRPCSPDGMPYLGRPRDWKNLIVAAGHAMMGLSLAPVTGQLVAELVEGGEVGEGREVLSPDRFTGR